jgi:simple sugar transport system ATP-binding protein
MEADASDVLRRLRVDIPSVKLKVEGLSGGRQQSVAIARAISLNPKVIVFDEPTANLSAPAIERLLELMVDLKKQNIAQVIISHRLQEIFTVGDRVMVLKRGRYVGERVIRETTEGDILRMIVHGDHDEEGRVA